MKNRKRIGRLLSCFLLVCGMLLGLAACGNEKKPTEGLEFTLNEDGESYSLKGIGTATGTKIVIPAAYEGKPVTRIKPMALINNQELTSVTLPESVTSIEFHAFSGCTGLTSITLSEGLTSIRVAAFADCTGLTSITFPKSLTDIGNSAFWGCTGLTSVALPKGVKYIASGAFLDCTGLTDVFYGGSAEDWAAIRIEDGNDPLKSVTIHYAS